MPDHIHIVLWAERGESVKKFLHRTLAQTSRRLQPGGGFWKERPHTIPIYSAKVLREKVDYLHRNPLRKNLAENPEDWRHSSYGQLVIGDCAPAFVCDDWGSYIT
jgi:REP element-mobilizing transposase RayT